MGYEIKVLKDFIDKLLCLLYSSGSHVESKTSVGSSDLVSELLTRGNKLLETMILSSYFRGGNYWKILSLLQKSTEKIYLSTIIFSCPRLCQICEQVKMDKISALLWNSAKIFYLPIIIFTCPGQADSQ